MAKQTINIGSSANDGTGDAIRDGGDKINDNFSEIYGVSGILKSNGSTTLSAAVSGTDYAPATSGSSILYGNGSGGFSSVTIGSGLTFSTGTLSASGGGSGTVTSVGVTVPSFLSASGSPVTTSGTIAISLANQTANTVFSGPTTGSAASPTFRALVLNDLPSGVGLTASTLAQFAATTSAQLAGVISDETGSGSIVFATSPTLVTPALGVASATSINKVTITAPATGATLTIPDGVTFTGPATSGTAVIQGAATGSGLTMATARFLGRTTASTGAIEELSATSATTLLALPGTLTIPINGGGSVITTGVKGEVMIPWGYTVTSWDIVADQSGSIVIDLWKDTYANYPPTVADTITGSAKPTLTAATKVQSSTLTGWTTTGARGDYLRWNVDSVSTVTRVTLTLYLTRS